MHDTELETKLFRILLSVLHQTVRHAHSLSNTEIKKKINSPLYLSFLLKFESNKKNNFVLANNLRYLKVATNPAGMNFPDLANLDPITPDRTNDVTEMIGK